MKLFDIAKGLLKNIMPSTPKITHHKPTRTPTPQETQIKRPAPTPETHTRQPSRAPSSEAPARRISQPAPKPTPRSRVTTGGEEYIRRGRRKKEPERKERKSAPDNPIKKQVKKWWDKLKPGEVKPKKEREQKPRPTKRKPATQPPKPKGRPIGAKDKKPRKPRTPKPRPIPIEPVPTPTDLTENEEPAKGELNVIEWLREQASWADNTFTVNLLMREIEDAIEREGFGEFCERITIDAINADVELAFYSSDAVDVYNGAMSLAALIGFNLNEDELFNAFIDDGLKNIDRVFGIKAFV